MASPEMSVSRPGFWPPSFVGHTRNNDRALGGRGFKREHGGPAHPAAGARGHPPGLGARTGLVSGPRVRRFRGGNGLRPDGSPSGRTGPVRRGPRRHGVPPGRGAEGDNPGGGPLAGIAPPPSIARGGSPGPPI